MLVRVVDVSKSACVVVVSKSVGVCRKLWRQTTSRQ